MDNSKQEKECEKSDCHTRIEIKVMATSHDINIRDTEHDDNSITMTKHEARYAIKEMQKYL